MKELQTYLWQRWLWSQREMTAKKTVFCHSVLAEFIQYTNGACISVVAAMAQHEECEIIFPFQYILQKLVKGDEKANM